MLIPVSQQDSQDAALREPVDYFTLCHVFNGSRKGEMVAEVPRCSRSLGLTALFSLLLCRETPAARVAVQSSCGESFDTALHPHALWVLKPVFQALHFFSEDTPVPPDASGKEAPDVIVAGSGKGGEWPGSIHQIRS